MCSPRLYVPSTTNVIYILQIYILKAFVLTVEKPRGPFAKFQAVKSCRKNKRTKEESEREKGKRETGGGKEGGKGKGGRKRRGEIEMW